MADDRVFRVTIRGRFRDLSDHARTYLVGARAEHDIFVSAFTQEGSLSYDDRIEFFNIRYEWRAVDSAAAESACLDEAAMFLTTMQFGHGDLRANVVDMSAMWDDVARRGRPVAGGREAPADSIGE